MKPTAAMHDDEKTSSGAPLLTLSYDGPCTNGCSRVVRKGGLPKTWQRLLTWYTQVSVVNVLPADRVRKFKILPPWLPLNDILLPP